MPGMAQLWLTEQELEILLDWYGTYEDEGYNDPPDDALARRVEDELRKINHCEVPR